MTTSDRERLTPVTEDAMVIDEWGANEVVLSRTGGVGAQRKR